VLEPADNAADQEKDADEEDPAADDNADNFLRN
jgi:hypothetical protein